MSKVRILPRWCLLMMFGLVFVTCAGTGGDGDTTLKGNPCSKGSGTTNRNAPIVCVDDTGGTLSVNPDPIGINSVGETDRQPVVIHWYTRSGGNVLSVNIQPGCVTDVDCNGSHCKARTLPVTARAQCKYTVDTDRHDELDPEIVIDPCCPSP